MRRAFLICILTVSFGVAPALAEEMHDRVVRELRANGYNSISANRTWLGRIRIVAEGDGLRREIVLNPRTGEILRDYVLPISSEEITSAGDTQNPTEALDPEDEDEEDWDDEVEEDDEDEEDEDDEDDEDEDDDRDEDDEEDERDDEDRDDDERDDEDGDD